MQTGRITRAGIWIAAFVLCATPRTAVAQAGTDADEGGGCVTCDYCTDPSKIIKGPGCLACHNLKIGGPSTCVEVQGGCDGVINCSGGAMTRQKYDALVQLVSAGSAEELAATVRALGSHAYFSALRSSIQVRGCSGAIVANLPLSKRISRQLAAELQVEPGEALAVR